MNFRTFALILTLMISVAKMNPTFGVGKEKKTIDANSKINGSGPYRRSEDNYIIINFDSSLPSITYQEGFSGDCTSREVIDHLIYNENDVTNERPLIIAPSTSNKLIIYFSDNVDSLANFFSKDNCDENSQYITEIDFSNFDSSSINSMEHTFSGCS
jgi:hypothetical protein